MKKHLLKNTYAAIVALFIAMMALPTTAQAQSIAKQALKSSSGEMSITNNKIKAASVKSSITFPLFEDFESGEIPDGWTVIDADNDGKNWMVSNHEKLAWAIPKSGKGVIASFSAEHTDYNPDNYLISPKISGATRLTYWFSLNTNYPDDRYQVLASTTGKDISDFTIVLKDERPTGLKPMDGSNQSEWVQRTLQLPVGTKYIAFRHFDSNKSGEGNYILLDNITIDGEIISYDLKICGTQVTSDNCGDLSVIDGVKGTVSYDPDSKILTLEDAKLNVEDKNGIWSDIDGLTIKMSGTNELNAKNAAISVSAPATITGGGTLNAESRKNCAIYARETSLTIKDCIVNAKGNYGIAGQNGSNEKLLISKATVTAEGWNGSICDFKEITLEDCAITQPAGAVVDNSQGAIVLNGETVTSEVKIVQTKYALKICDTQVTSDNCGDLSAIDGVEGTVKYDPYSKTLTLEGATIKNTKEGAGGRGIVNEIDGLTIRLVGDNIISTENSIGILNGHEKAITFTGEGKLRVNGSMRSTYDNCRGIDNYGTITITGCTLEASAGVSGLSGGKWKFDRCTVRAKGGGIEDHEQYGSIEWLNDKPEFIGCEIIAPKGTYWKEFKGATTYYSLFGEDDKVVTDWVTIADPTGINTPTIDTAAKQGIYTLSGVKLNGKVEDLPKGVYIVNGKKVMK